MTWIKGVIGCIIFCLLIGIYLSKHNLFLARKYSDLISYEARMVIVHRNKKALRTSTVLLVILNISLIAILLWENVLWGS